MNRDKHYLHPRLNVDLHAQKLALVIADAGDFLTYAQLVENADRASQLFLRLGLVEGDTITIFLENHIRYPELCWAAKNSGITYACISRYSSVEEATYIVENADARLLVSSVELADTAVQVARQSAGDLHLLMVDEAIEPFKSYESLIEKEPAIPLEGRRRGPSMLYSSGTTGRPKGVRVALPDEPPEVPPRRLAMLQEHYGLDTDTVLVNPGPLYHAAPNRFMMSVQRVGGTVIGFRRFDAEATLEAIDSYRATHGLFVPTMLNRMLRLDDTVKNRYDVSSLRCALHMAAPCPIPVKEQMIEWWGPIIEEMYGGTEAIGYTLINSREWLEHKGSVGRPAGGTRIRILDEEGNDLPPYQPGMIYMNNGQCFEYHKDPEKTQKVYLEGGWATFGDIGYLDEDGYLYLTDRKAHVIVSGGVNIYPQETESVLHHHPAVADVAVIGVPNEEYGEEVKAVVLPKEAVTDPEALANDVIAFCRKRLSPIKCPRSVDFVDELPRNEAGKLLKRLVKERYWRERKSRII